MWISGNFSPPGSSEGPPFLFSLAVHFASHVATFDSESGQPAIEALHLKLGDDRSRLAQSALPL